MANEPLDVIGIALLVASAMEAVAGEYFVGGSVASSLQGDPRATNDIDFVVSLPVGKATALRDALGDDFEVDTDALRHALLRASCAGGRVQWAHAHREVPGGYRPAERFGVAELLENPEFGEW